MERRRPPTYTPPPMSGQPAIPSPTLSAVGLRVAVIVARYNARVTDRLRDGAAEAFRALGGAGADLEIIAAPGSFELATLAGGAAKSGRFDALVALGCLIKGETSHDRVIADAVASTLAMISAQTPIAIGFGLLTVDNQEQAEARAGGALGNKGAEAMQAAIATAAALRDLRRKA